MADIEENDHVKDVQKKVWYTQACVINLNPLLWTFTGAVDNLVSKLAHFRFPKPKCVKWLNLQLMQNR